MIVVYVVSAIALIAFIVVSKLTAVIDRQEEKCAGYAAEMCSGGLKCLRCCRRKD